VLARTSIHDGSLPNHHALVNGYAGTPWRSHGSSGRLKHRERREEGVVRQARHRSRRLSFHLLKWGTR